MKQYKLLETMAILSKIAEDNFRLLLALMLVVLIALAIATPEELPSIIGGAFVGQYI